MGHSRLIPFVVEVTTDRGHWTPSEWRMRKRGLIPADGKATTENLKKYALGYEASTSPGGVNSHIGLTHILTARIKDQRTGEILATYTRDPIQG
jgi:hypothetical protein